MTDFRIDMEKTRKNNPSYIFTYPCISWNCICIQFNKGKCKKGHKLISEPWGSDTEYYSEKCKRPEYKTVLVYDDKIKKHKVINKNFVKNRLKGLGQTSFHHTEED